MVRGRAGIERLYLLGLCAAVLCAACATSVVTPDQGRRSPAGPGAETELLDEPIRPLPLAVETDSRKVALGDRLFHEKAFSVDDTIACVSCHEFNRGGADGMSRSIGLKGKLTDFNSPTVFNAFLNVAQFWDGRAVSLEAQVEQTTHSVVEMGSDWEKIISKLRAKTGYSDAFNAIYPDGMTADNIKNAVAEFERSLVTPNARFDRYLRGDAGAISAEEKNGYGLFKDFGCVACHQGMGVGGNIFETFGVFGNPFEDRVPRKPDFGRFNVTGKEADRFVFKVPSLRNVALTAPYFHDGSAPDLERAVVVMARYQLGRVLSEEETRLIVAFLGTLTGEVPPSSGGQ